MIRIIKIISIVLLIVFFNFNCIFAETKIIYENGYTNPDIVPTDTLRDLTSKLFDAKIGNTIIFGRYEQNNNVDDGKEPLEWIVIGKDEIKNIATLITKDIIDCEPYSKVMYPVDWASSWARYYMMNTMVKEMFTMEELNCVINMNNENLPNPYFPSDKTPNTSDYIYLPSIYDMKKYFSGIPFDNDELKYEELKKKNKIRIANATPYAINKFLRTGGESDYPNAANYLLRTQGYDTHRRWYGDTYADFFITYIRENGSLNPEGTGINSIDDGLRPMCNVYY